MEKKIKPVWIGPAALFLLLFSLVMVRNCACGAVYYPQLDDYIQYHNYSSVSSFRALQESVGLLGARPLAGLADYFVWGPMWDHMILGVALISLLYVGAAMLAWKILGRYFRLSPLFPVLVTLIPLGIEGTYWMSASTRVVVGMFFAVLAAWTFLWWLDKGGWGRLVLCLAVQLIPINFYEQAGILSVTLTVGAAILEWTLNKKPLKRCVVSLWGVPAMGLYLLVTRLLASGGVYSSRMEVVLPVSRYFWTHQLPKVLWQFVCAFLGGGFFTLVKGFVRSARMIFSGQLLAWTLAVLVLSVLLVLLAMRWREEEREKRPLWLPLVCGLLLAAGPASLFLVIGNPWFSLRGTVPSFLGLALIVDAVLVWLWDKLPVRLNGPAVLAGAAAFVFCVAGASEMTDYRDTYENDQRIAHLVIDTLAADGVGGDAGRVGILNLEPSYLPNQNYFFHEHIHGCTESGWAFGGLLAAEGGGGLPSVTPLPSDPMYRAWNREANHPSGFTVLYWFDGTNLIPARLEEQAEDAWLVRDPEGGLLGRIWEENGIGYIRPSEQKSLTER
ncbi:MAG: hypothetical protein K2N78_10365 [Oscillospiraceae bacterium]|nr:hypothetical protein [Oscillospiraceae bacterium]